MAVASVHRSWWSRIKRALLYLFIFQLAYIILLRWVDPPLTMTQLSAWVSPTGLQRDYVRADRQSPYARLAVIAAEDQLFLSHHGFDWERIQKAFAYNKQKPNRLRGGSLTLPSLGGSKPGMPSSAPAESSPSIANPNAV